MFGNSLVVSSLDLFSRNLDGDLYSFFKIRRMRYFLAAVLEGGDALLNGQPGH